MMHSVSSCCRTLNLFLSWRVNELAICGSSFNEDQSYKDLSYSGNYRNDSVETTGFSKRVFKEGLQNPNYLIILLMCYTI